MCVNGNTENKSDREILQELLEGQQELLAGQQRQEKWRIIKLIINLAVVAALLVFCFAYVPKGLESLRQIQASMTQMKQATAEIQSVFEVLSEAGYENPAEAIEQILTMTSEIQEVLDALKEAGVENPAQAVEEFRAFADQASEFFSMFGEDGLQRLKEGLEGFGQNFGGLFGIFG